MQTTSRALLFRSAGMGLWLLATAFSAGAQIVTTNADSGAGSLRQAIADAASGATITFDPALNGSAITLTSGQLDIAKNLTIQGPGPGLLAIDGNHSSRIFSLSPGAGTTMITFTGLAMTNGAAANGGAIVTITDWNTQNITLTLSNCVIRANRANGPASNYSGGGGIVASRNTTLRMYDCTIADNQSIASGGGVWIFDVGTFERCTFLNNRTTVSGGGMLCRRWGPVHIINCTFSGNAAASGIAGHNTGGGGGLHTQEGGVVFISNSTFTGNIIQGTASTHRGGGIFSQGTTTMGLRSTIMSGNIGNTHGYPDIAGTFTGVTNSLIQVTNGVSIVGANNIFSQAAQLDPLASNGGPTRTHALQKTSPAIDKGYNPLNLVTDQRGPGFPRLLGTAVDIGAYEFQPLPGGTLITLR